MYRVLAMLCTIVLGFFISLQVRINGELGARLNDAYLAATLSFGTGLVLLSAVTFATRSGRAGVQRMIRALRRRSVPRWYFAGGVMGAYFVLAQTLTAPILGVAMFTVAIVAGSTITALILDRRGLGTMAPRRITGSRLVGAVIMIIAVAWAGGAQITALAGQWWLVLPLIGGLGITVQQAITGQVREVTQSVTATAWNNFSVGFIVLLAIFIGRGLVVGFPTRIPSQWWLYLGGLVGVIFVAGVSLLVRYVGVLLFGLASVSGQLVGSLVLDVVVPVPGRSLSAATIAGTVLALIAIIIAAIPGKSKVPKP